jgi:pimeloyl-ACP methyl ester carboxylesterase
MINLLLIIIIILLNKKLSDFDKNIDTSIKDILKNTNTNSKIKIKSIWHSVPNNGFNKNESWKVHSLYVNNNNDLPCLLLIHGVNSSSITWIDILIKLSYKFRIYAIDLPGFGHSPTPECLIDASAKQSTNLIINMLKQWLKVNKINKISLLGHSFGGFISINFAYKYPELVDRIILAAPVGILPTLDKYGAYWGLFFKLTPVQRILTIFGPSI